MTAGKALVRVSVGLFLGAIVLGLLPFLLVYSGAEILGISELYTSPLILLQKLFEFDGRNDDHNKK